MIVMTPKATTVQKRCELKILRTCIHDDCYLQLSASVVEGLHHIVHALQAHDYNTAHAYYGHMVSQGNFSEISSFMPGVKILLQTAMQMNVFVQN